MIKYLLYKYIYTNMPNLVIRWEDIINIPVIKWTDIENIPDSFPPDTSETWSGPINIRGDLITEEGNIKENGIYLENKYLKKEETAFNTLLFNGHQLDVFKIKNKSDLFISNNETLNIKGLVYHVDVNSNWDEYLVKISDQKTPWGKGSIGRKIDKNREWVIFDDDNLFSVEGTTGNIWFKGDLYIRDGSNIRFDETFDTSIYKNGGSSELIINIDSQELNTISFKIDGVDILNVREQDIQIYNPIHFNESDTDLLYLSNTENINIGKESGTLFFRAPSKFKFYLGGDPNTLGSGENILSYDNTIQTWNFEKDITIRGEPLLSQLNADDTYLSIQRIGKWLFKSSIVFWGIGNYCYTIILNRYDGWYYLPRLLPYLDNLSSSNGDTIRRYKIKINLGSNSNNIYEPSSTDWDNGRYNGYIWIRILSDNHIELFKAVVTHTSNSLNNTDIYYLELPEGIETNNNISIQLGIFWDDINSSWPSSNIEGDIEVNNYTNYGSHIEFSIEYLSIEIYDVIPN